ncbi:Orn/Lys/Arg decarboxylase N-terminal domain-containing protein [Ruegeria arenilitoris]|uniref:Orn/Lys/Arg family decarboxylase n=1 Tax=Ruegeria arenilitoris TaxID=1173585 RepID=UPI00147C73E0|nr:Orn/Lys/Arg decarboxylase N-terminal domain-containing protein [Ruegeria arenilitoris]
MEYNRLFQIFVVHSEIEDETVSGRLLRAIIRAVRDRGYEVLTAQSTEQAIFQIQNDASIACFLIGWDSGDEGLDTEEVLASIRHRGLESPVFLVTERHRISDLTDGVLEQIRGTVFPQEDTPDFIAKYVLRAYSEYVEGLKTPFFGGMIDYVEAGNQMWLAPGHNGGIFYEKSPIGRVLFDYLGENFWRADFNFVPDLGDIFGPTGPFLKAEQQAAEIFGADRTYFVLNGSSTSNKMVNGSLIAPGDLVLFDRNNHKSHHHSALMLNGGIPIYLPDDRNSFGMVGPIEFDALDEDKLRQQIRDNPLVTDPDAWKKDRPFRAALLENCTYDGTIYQVETIREKLGHLCDYLLFDEAWGGFMRFHPIYRNRYAMGLEKLGTDDPGVFAVQSTHKQLAGMSQASQFHVKDNHIKGQDRRVNHKRINEIFMMHTSTSPFYPMYASLDVGAQMMKGKNGTFLWDEALRLGIDIRKKARELARGFRNDESDPNKKWFFDPFVPDKVTIKGSDHCENMTDATWEDLPTDLLVNEQQCWWFREGADWHGYTRIVDGYAMVDPTKMLFLTPGVDRKTGNYQDWGIPAAILGAFLRSRGIVPEKTDFNSILFLLTPGLERSKAGTLLAELVSFKRLFDSNAMVEEVLPDLIRDYPDRYSGMHIRELAQGLHDLYKRHDAKALQKKQFQQAHFPELAMSPHDAHSAFIANQADYIPMTDVKGRVAATLALVYPPGIGVVVPGERYDDRAQPQIDYFMLFEETENQFPGFENEVQGVYREEVDGAIRYFTYVVKE